MNVKAMDRINKINKIKNVLVFVNPVNPVYSARFIAFALCAALAGCGLVNWSVSNGSDGCPDARGAARCP